MKRQDRLVGYQNKTGNEHELSCGAGSDNFILHKKLKFQTQVSQQVQEFYRTPRFRFLSNHTIVVGHHTRKKTFPDDVSRTNCEPGL